MDALLTVVWTQSDRSALADALYTYSCFQHVIEPQEDRDQLYARLVSAAFQPDEEWMWASKRKALLRTDSTPKIVRRLLKGLTRPQRWRVEGLSRQQWRRFGTWARRHRLAYTIGVVVVAIALTGTATVLYLSHDNAPSPQAFTPPAPRPILVKDTAQQPYVMEVIKEALKREGYQPDVQVQGSPNVLIGDDPEIRGVMETAGLTPVGDFPSGRRDILIVRDGQQDLPEEILVRETFSKDVEARIQEHYSGSHLHRVPDDEFTRRLIKRDTEAAIVSDGVAAQGYEASDDLGDLLPERRILVGADSALQPALKRAMDGLGKEGVKSSDDPAADAKAFVDRIYSPAPSLVSSAEPVRGPAGISWDVIAIVCAIVGVAGLIAMVPFFRRSSRYEGSLTGRHRA
ncbi:hypothetical protein [Microbispora triticiradicis]|uniref:hypothetical protein n=1 Tax=Microbispora triticiradicis TaxID=2200763 RepID=UPI001AD748AE|nr:hypothetical protein [Microbispora triticiradicis]MBO4274815.1 hypothetical protein [Microbispora triticiradicis]